LLEEILSRLRHSPDIGFAEGRLEERGVLDRTELRRIKPRETLQIGDMHFEFLRVTHSIADSIGLAIRLQPDHHSHWDFKFDQSPTDHQVSDYARFAHFGESGVLALLSDSTNSERPLYTSESHVRRHLTGFLHQSTEDRVHASPPASSHPADARPCRRIRPQGHTHRKEHAENIAIADRLGYLSIPRV